MLLRPKIQIYLTSKCSYQCTYCPVYDNSKEDIKFDTDFISVLNQFPNKPEVFIYGGEPFQYKYLVETINFLTSLDLEVSIQTNANNLQKFDNFLIKPKLKLTYHPDKISQLFFLKQVNKYSMYLESISIMVDLSNELQVQTLFKLYKSLRLIYKNRPEVDILFCPIINFNSNSTNYILPPEILKILIKNNDYHFTLQEENIIQEKTYYQIWNEYSGIIYNNKIKHCSIQNYQFEIKDNKIYRCEQYWKNNETGIKFKDFNLQNYINQCSDCFQKECYFFNSCYQLEKL